MYIKSIKNLFIENSAFTPQRRRRNETPENDLKKAILSYLHFHKIPAWRINSGAVKIQNRYIRFSVLGIADIIGVLPDGRFLAVETKSAGNTLIPGQKGFLETITRNNGVAIVAYSINDIFGIENLCRKK
jgi:VRR-NUC domain